MKKSYSSLRTIVVIKNRMVFLSCLVAIVSFFGMIAANGTSSASVTPQIAGGDAHTIALKSEGTVWTWGYNVYGQLGDGSTTNRTTPVEVSNLSGITAVAGGFSHTIALKSDGTVWTWGYNTYGQLGDETNTSRSTPVKVSNLSGVIAIANGANSTIALKSDGTVWAWGDNESGELGDGTTTNRKTPVQVSSLGGIAAIAGGSEHTIALKSDGTVWAWGHNRRGQLGDGTTTGRYIPVQVRGLNLYSTTTTTPTPTPSPPLSPTPSPTPSPTSTPSGTGIVFGYVYDEDENPLRSVTVEIEGDDYSDSGKTDADGYYEFNEIPAGDYTVTYTKTGYETQTQEVTVEAGEDVQLESVTMVAVQKGSIYGYVTDIRGDPIESVKLKLSGIRTKIKKSTSTDSDGFFEFTDLEADTYRIVAKKRFYKTAQITVAVEEGEDVEIEIEMKKTKSRKILPGEEDPDVIESVFH